MKFEIALHPSVCYTVCSSYEIIDESSRSR